MKKIPTLYIRDPETNLRYVRNEVHPDCQWVLDGEGSPTYKWNGTAVMIDEAGVLHKRREVKRGKEPPPTFQQTGDADPNTGKLVGWVTAETFAKEDRWHFEGLGHMIANWPDETTWPEGGAGTYELVGPKIQGNPHRLEHHTLVRHGFHIDGQRSKCGIVPTRFADLGSFLHGTAELDPGFEGIVWHNHFDRRMAKIKAKDFPK